MGTISSLFVGLLLVALVTLILRSGDGPVSVPNGRNDVGHFVAYVVYGLAILWTVYQVFSSIQIARQLKHRTLQLAAAAGSYGLVSRIPGNLTNCVSLTMLDLGKRDQYIKNYYVAHDWEFFDYQYALYQSTKHGEYKERTVHYAVASFTLPRALPNVFFDSHKTGKREFQNLFEQSQRHSLEGDFDQYFDTYFGQDYVIDNLSFISPEVMQSLIVAQGYDIEIFLNKLFLYRELEDMPMQLQDMYVKGGQVRSALMNNILTYRDERINYAEGRRRVSVAGARLRRSLRGYYVAIAGNSLIFGFFAAFYLAKGRANIGSLLFLASFWALSVAGSVSMRVRAKRQNDRFS